MAYDGKIAGHFPGRGNPNLDTLRIDYLAEGASTPSSISDMQKIQEVYACRAGETLTLQNLEDHLVWRYFDELLNDTTQGEYLMFAFKPERNISVNSLGIFTDGDGNASTALVICSDDGLLLYKGNDTQESTENTEIYGLSGIKRTRTFGSAITLYAGKTYWIHYHFSDCRNHRGAYFNGFNGHACLGKYKNMSNFSFTNFSSETAYPQYANVNFGTPAKIEGNNNAEKIALIMSAAQNKLFYYDASQWQEMDVRNNYLVGKYKCSIKSTNGDSITTEQFDACNFSIDDVFMILNQHYDGQMTICQVKQLSGDVTARYNVIIGPSQDWTALSSLFLNKLSNNKRSFIQYYDDGSYANNWNQTYTDKRYYLELNGTERCAGDERK